MAVSNKNVATLPTASDRESVALLKPIRTILLTFHIESLSPLIQHRWSEKSLQQMRDKHQKKTGNTREKRDPEAEYKAAMYRDEDGAYGFPLHAMSSALLEAAHKDIGITKKNVSKAGFFSRPPRGGADNIVPMTCSEPWQREDHVRLSMNSTDLRYRPQFDEWGAELTVTIDIELLHKDDFITLINRAGFGVGIGEWRPEKGGEYGRFEIDTSKEMTEITL